MKSYDGTPYKGVVEGISNWGGNAHEVFIRKHKIRDLEAGYDKWSWAKFKKPFKDKDFKMDQNELVLVDPLEHQGNYSADTGVTTKRTEEKKVRQRAPRGSVDVRKKGYEYYQEHYGHGGDMRDGMRTRYNADRKEEEGAYWEAQQEELKAKWGYGAPAPGTALKLSYQRTKLLDQYSPSLATFHEDGVAQGGGPAPKKKRKFKTKKGKGKATAVGTETIETVYRPGDDTLGYLMDMYHDRDPGDSDSDESDVANPPYWEETPPDWGTASSIDDFTQEQLDEVKQTMVTGLKKGALTIREENLMLLKTLGIDINTGQYSPTLGDDPEEAGPAEEEESYELSSGYLKGYPLKGAGNNRFDTLDLAVAFYKNADPGTKAKIGGVTEAKYRGKTVYELRKGKTLLPDANSYSIIF